MATFNGEKFIEKQILSIKNQFSSNISILVSDDGSNDNTLFILKKLKEKHKLDLKILSNKIKTESFNGNFINLFLNANVSNFDYIALSDQDDIFLQNKFKTSIDILNSGNFSAISTTVKTFGSSNKFLRQSSKISKYDFLFEGGGQGCSFVMKSKDFLLFKKFCLVNLEFLKSFYYHDWLIYLFFRSTGMSWCFYDNALTKYRIHSTNNTGEKYSFGGVLKRFLKILNGWYLNQIIHAIKIHNRISPKSNQIKISFFNLFILIVFHGRRKLSDRFVSLFCLFCYPFKKR
jgi:rhamnosyltransferase